MAACIPIIVIVGPTGVGKTRLSIRVAQAVDGEIVSVDSIQVYRDCPVMAAQVKKEEMEGVPHHLVNYLDVLEEPVDFVVQAMHIIQSIHNRGRVPIICGGSTSLIEPILFHDLSYQQDVLAITLHSDLAIIENLCDDRINQMFKEGLLDEVKHLYELEKQHKRFDVSIFSGAWKSIGYPELREWCNAESTEEAERLLQDGTRLMKRNTLNYAATQLHFLQSRLLPALLKRQHRCYVFNVKSRRTFHQDVEIPALKVCQEWIIDVRQEYALSAP